MSKEDSIDQIKESHSEEDLKRIVKSDVSLEYLTPSRVASTAIGDIYRNLNIVDETFGLEDVYGLDRQTLQNELVRQNEELFSGDMKRVEAMLLDQSHVLQALFTFLVQKMSGTEYLNQLDTYTRLALKAQNQCRQTLATLGELKNPKRATFIKQQNNAMNQQINNSEKNQAEDSNELLEVLPSERLDTRAPQEAIGDDQELEAMGAINGPEDGYRETEG